MQQLPYCRCVVQVVTANLPTGSLLALLLTALTAANPFSAFAVTLEPVALMLQRRLWNRPKQQQQQQQQEGHDSDAAGSGSIDSSSDNKQPPYLVRAAVRLGEPQCTEMSSYITYKTEAART
jgi:hypothetical protein